MAAIVKLLPFLALATLTSIMGPTAAFAMPKAEKVYGADGRRVAVIKRTNFGTKVYGQDGRRVAVIRSR